jgi:hypothetical protein
MGSVHKTRMSRAGAWLIRRIRHRGRNVDRTQKIKTNIDRYALIGFFVTVSLSRVGAVFAKTFILQRGGEEKNLNSRVGLYTCIFVI